MPRQPYLPTFAHLNYAVGALVLEDRPDLCAAIGRAVAIWSHVDDEMGHLFGVLLGTESDAALEVFLSLRRASNQVDALRVAAQHSLSGVELETCTAVLSVYKSLEIQRNALAHGCFGVCPEDPTILFWMDLAHHIHFRAEVFQKGARGVIDDDRHARLKQSMYVYRLADMQHLYEEMKQFWRAVFWFNGYLRKQEDPHRQEDFDKMRKLAVIKRALPSSGPVGGA